MNTIATIMIQKSETSGLSLEVFLATVAYAFLGMVLLMLFAAVINRLFRLDLRKELVEDNNVGLGAAVGGVAIAIAIIIAGTILS
ncbi:MAG: DUF350 domain-containing protein [Candidatus Saccharibacteria bacterium]|nr:DUF350 domain-containing protein [Candidatus Saccharibacteria bacterium]